MTSQMRVFFRIVDIICILIAFGVSSHYMLPPNLEIFSDYTGASTLTVLIFFLSFYMLDCYAVGREEFKDTVIRVVVAVCIGIIGTGFLFYTFESWRFPRFMFVVQMAITLVLCLGWRCLFFMLRHRFKTHEERIILLGAGMAERAHRILTEHKPDAEILGYAGEPGADAAAAGPCLGPADNIVAIARAHKASTVLVLDSYYLDEPVAEALLAAKLRGLRVADMRLLYERLASRLPIDLIEDQWLLLADGFHVNANSSMLRLKRAFDVGFALFLLVLTAPLVAVIMLLVRLESPGAVVYTQRRTGFLGKEFTVYKIRSMCQNAETGGAVWASKNDARVTRIGKFIRKTRIDELPQLINVLKGEMSVVGPRPERPDFVHELEAKLPYYQVRHTVKPGITGWAQVCYPYGASLEDSRYKLEYDLYYIKNLSMLLEAKIILKTIGVVLFPKGAR